MTTISEQVLEKVNSPPVDKRQRTEELGQEEFLSLMVAQVQNQDPFSPMENGEFIAQMAQFAAVEGIGEMQQSLEALTQSITASQTLAASSLVGRSVMSPGNSFELASSGGLDASVDVPAGTSQVLVNVYDQAGVLVATQTVSAIGQGSVPVHWNGLDSTGERASPGHYRVDAQAVTQNESVAAEVAIRRQITSVTVGQGAGNLKLNLDNGQSVNFSQVREFS